MVKLTAAATTSIPRIIIFALTLVYGFAGLFARDPWKNEDAIGFGGMWTLHNGKALDWIVPHLAGRDASLGAPFPYWLGATLMDLFGPLIGIANAARLYAAVCFFAAALAIWYATYLLGRRPEVQPMVLAVGGQPGRKNYGMTLADGALLIFLACVGLAQRAHETTPMMAQLMGISIVLYGTVRGLDKPWQGGLWTGLGIAIIALSSNLTLSLIVVSSTIIAVIASNAKLRFRWTLTSTVLGLIGFAIWPALWYLSNLTPEWRHIAEEGWRNMPEMRATPSIESLGFLSVNFWAYAWPVWPLAIISLAHWGRIKEAGQWRAPHLCIPLSLFIGCLIYVLFRLEANEHDLIILIPSLSIIAAFSLPILKRSLISFIDWFAMFSFTIIALAIWIIWLAKVTGFPESTASNLARLLPGFQAQFDYIGFVIALIITGVWLAIVRWRTSRAPKEIWRCLIISASGTTLMWVLLMTLWLPTINYAKTYRYVSDRLETIIANTPGCIDTTNLGSAQLASFDYFTKLPLRDDPSCNLMLTHSSSEAKAYASLNKKKIELLWEDRRASDRDERLRLYQITPAGKE
jgi:4-amino-4-deoxy-L-arabinose transferase-like glycosyltransferase